MTSGKVILKTDAIPRVGLNFMNHTHFEEVQMVEQFGQLILAYQNNERRTDKDAAELSEKLAAWIEHTRDHFNRENELMIDTGFPAYPIHSGEHERVLQEMQVVETNWNDNKEIDPLVNYVFNAWPEWFSSHVNSMDMMTAQFAMMQGYNADSCPLVSS